MKPDIVQKLEGEFDEPIRSERQVVYILAEVRKLLELESIARDEARVHPDDSYFALKFYCDWAVHVRLTQSGAKQIVRRFDEYQKFLDDAASLGEASGIADDKLLRELDQGLQLSKFRNQFGALVASHGLKPSLVTNEEHWIEFLIYYSRVIEDAPLTSMASGLERVDTVSVSVLDERPPRTAEYRFALRWTWISKKDGMRNNIVRLF